MNNKASYLGWIVAVILAAILAIMVYMQYFGGHTIVCNCMQNNQDQLQQNPAPAPTPTTTTTTIKELPDKAYKEMKQSSISYEWKNSKTLEIRFEQYKNLSTADGKDVVFFPNEAEYQKFIKDVKDNPELYKESDPGYYSNTRIVNLLDGKFPEIASWQIPSGSNVLLITFKEEPSEIFSLKSATGYWQGLHIYLEEETQVTE